MLAYVSWHRPAPDVEQGAYEHALEHFHRSLSHRPPAGFRGSVSFRAGELPWLVADVTEQESATTHLGCYEDWYLLDGWSSVGVLEEASISQGHITAHDSIAKLAGPATGSVYRLSDGHDRLAEARMAVWVTRDRGHKTPTMADLLADGMDPAIGGLWRRCMGLGPAPEYCLLGSEPTAGVAPTRLPTGWNATVHPREVLWHG